MRIPQNVRKRRGQVADDKITQQDDDDNTSLIVAVGVSITCRCRNRDSQKEKGRKGLTEEV